MNIDPLLISFISGESNILPYKEIATDGSEYCILYTSQEGEMDWPDGLVRYWRELKIVTFHDLVSDPDAVRKYGQWAVVEFAGLMTGVEWPSELTGGSLLYYAHELRRIHREANRQAEKCYNQLNRE